MGSIAEWTALFIFRSASRMNRFNGVDFSEFASLCLVGPRRSFASRFMGMQRKHVPEEDGVFYTG